ncbi:hypothetical protein Gpo141_00007397 [Globisporangium polare]
MSKSSYRTSTRTRQPASHDAATASDNPESSTPSSSRPRPRTGSAPPSTASARPFSSSNLSASIANARFKTFQVQYEILSKNAVLSAIAQEIPWKNLLDLFLLKFYAVGDILWHQGEQSHDMAFVLCGGFLARHMELPVEPSNDSPSLSYTNGAVQPHRDHQHVLGTILAEKMVKPGGTLAALAVHTNAHMQYTVVTAKFKSIVLSLPAGKYKSILRHLTPELKQQVEHLLYDTENKLLSALRMRPVVPPKDSTSKHHHHGSTVDKQLAGKHKHNGHSPRKKQSGSGNSSHTLHRAASTPALSSAASSLTNSAAMSLDATASWVSLQVAKPVEYEVNSSLLILHQPSSTGDLYHLAPSVASSSTKKLVFGGGLLHSSSVARLTAKKHTQRRLQSIKTPNPIEAFPPQPKNANDLMDQAMLAAFSSAAAGGTRASHLDVVPKVHVGRLLKPLRKPAMLSDDADCESSGTSRLAGKSMRPHTVAQEQHLSQRVLVADRAEPFRDLW